MALCTSIGRYVYPSEFGLLRLTNNVIMASGMCVGFTEMSFVLIACVGEAGKNAGGLHFVARWRYLEDIVVHFLN